MTAVSTKNPTVHGIIPAKARVSKILPVSLLRRGYMLACSCSHWGVVLASLADIAVMKANAYHSRDNDMVFAVNKMVEMKEKELELIKQIVVPHGLEELTQEVDYL